MHVEADRIVPLGAEIAEPRLRFTLRRLEAMGRVAVGPAVGDALSVRAHIAGNYEHKGHHFVELDALVLANETTPIAHIAHTAIYRPRQLAERPWPRRASARVPALPVPRGSGEHAPRDPRLRGRPACRLRRSAPSLPVTEKAMQLDLIAMLAIFCGGVLSKRGSP